MKTATLINAKTPVFLDFETYMDKKRGYSLSGMSDIQYITDPRFQVVSVAIGYGGKCRVYPGNTPEWSDRIIALNTEENIFVAHNSRFDFRILLLRYSIRPVFMSDTLLLARYLGYPKAGLKELANRCLGLTKLEYKVDGQRLEDITGAKWDGLLSYNAWDIKLTKKLYDLFTPLVPGVEHRLIDQTLRLCLMENHIDWERGENLTSDLRGRLRDLEESNGELYLNRTKPLWVRGFIRTETGVDPGTIDKRKVDGSKLPTAAKGILHKLWSIRELEKSIKELAGMKERMGLPGKNSALVDLNYSKAVTHRWSSGGEESKSFNMQNMRRSGGVRELWVPDAGHYFIIVDLSQIEARVAAWYGGEAELLHAFARNECVYCKFGKHVFGHELNRATEKDERTICKQAILGLQFGMGWKRFLDILRNSAPVALEETTLRLKTGGDEKTAENIVAVYRSSYRQLSSMPKLAYNAFISAVRTNVEATLGFGAKFRVKYARPEKCLEVSLPTGGKLYYRDIGISMVPSRFDSSRKEPSLTYASNEGTKIITYPIPFENLVQATARDILAHQLLEAEEHGLKLRMHTHDEAIFQTSLKSVSDDYAKVTRIFSSPLETCPGLPLSCEAQISDRYTKDDEYLKKTTAQVLAKESIKEQVTL